MKYICFAFLCVSFISRLDAEIPLIKFELNQDFNMSNSNHVTKTSSKTKKTEQNIFLNPHLLELTETVKKHWLNASYGAVGASLVGSYLLLVAYIVRNKGWIYYGEAWHAWRNDVSLEVIKQVDAHITAQELWKAIQNKYQGKQTGEMFIAFINETSHEIDRISTFISACDRIESLRLSYITPGYKEARRIAAEKLERLHLIQNAVTATVVAALTI